jgi:hypothetical protein
MRIELSFKGFLRKVFNMEILLIVFMLGFIPCLLIWSSYVEIQFRKQYGFYPFNPLKRGIKNGSISKY